MPRVTWWNFDNGLLMGQGPPSKTFIHVRPLYIVATYTDHETDFGLDLELFSILDIYFLLQSGNFQPLKKPITE